MMNSTTLRTRNLRRTAAVVAMGAAFSLAAACATEVTGSAQAPGAGQPGVGQQQPGGEQSGGEQPGGPRESDDGEGTASAQLPSGSPTFEPPTVSAVVPPSIDPGGGPESGSDGGGSDPGGAGTATGPAEPTEPGTSDDDDQPTAKADTGGAPGSGATSSGGSHGVPETAGAGTASGPLNWPDDLCSLLPEGIEEEGVEKQESDPTLRCMYSGSTDEGDYQMVTLLKIGRINPDDPIGGNGTDLREEKIGGDASWSYQQDKASVAVVAVGDDGFSVALAYDGASTSEVRSVAVKLAGHVLKQLTG